MKGANSATISALLRHLSEGTWFERDIIVSTRVVIEMDEQGNWDEGQVSLRTTWRL